MTEELLGRHVRTKEDMESAAEELHKRWGCAVLAREVISRERQTIFFTQKKEDSGFPGRGFQAKIHTDSCTLSSAIAAAWPGVSP